MLSGQLRLSLLIFAFTVASAVFDAMGFTYAAQVWQGTRLNGAVAAKSAASFMIGITMYWAAVRFLSEAGIVTAELQSLLWLGVTIVGVAVLGGRFFQWPLVDQVLAVNVLASLAWLISRAGAAAA